MIISGSHERSERHDLGSRRKVHPYRPRRELLHPDKSPMLRVLSQPDLCMFDAQVRVFANWRWGAHYVSPPPPLADLRRRPRYSPARGEALPIQGLCARSASFVVVASDIWGPAHCSVYRE